MAQIHEEVIVIKLSKLVKNKGENLGIADQDTINAVEQVVQELVGSNVIVEIEKA